MKYLIRLFTFWFKLIAITLLVGALIYIVFFMAMDMINIGIIAKDGMVARAEYVIKEQFDDAKKADSKAELNRFFTDACLKADEKMLDISYKNYTIKSFNHKMKTQWIWVWPWQTETSVRITERISYIDGDLLKEFKTEEQITEKTIINPPAWENCVIDLVCVKRDGRWKIDAIQFVELATDENKIVRLTMPPTPTPAVEATPTPTFNYVPETPEA